MDLEIQFNNLEEKVVYLEKELAKSKKIQKALMERVESNVKLAGSDYSLFETNAILQKIVDSKSYELKSTNQDLQRHILEKDIIQNDLKESQDRLQSIVDSLVDVVYSRSYPGFDTLFLSSSVDLIYERSQEDFFKNKDLWFELIHPTDKPYVLKKIELAYSGEMQEIAYRIFLPNGKIKWLRDRFKVVFDEDGYPIRFDGLVSDITYQKEAEVKIIESEYKFRTLADYTMDWEYWIDPKNQYIYISPSCEKISGYSPEEFQANSDLILTIIHPDDYDNFSAHLDSNHSNYAQAGTDEMEFRIMRKDNQLRYIHHICRPIFDNDGNYLGRRVSNRDITDRKLAEIELKRKNHLIESILDNAPILIWLNDDKGNQLFGNKHLTQMTMFDDGSVSMTNEEFSQCISTDLKTLSNNEPQHFIENVTFVDGKVHNIQTVKTNMYDENGSIIGVLGLGVDISESLKSTEALIESEARNRALLNASPDFVFILSSDMVFLDFHTSNPEQLIVPPDHFMNRRLRDTLPPRLAINLERFARKAISEKAMQTYEYDVEIEGQKKFYEARINTFGSNQIIAMIRDITETKIAAQKLDDLYKLHTIINEISSKLIQSSLDEVNISINDAIAKLGEYSNVDRVYIFDFNELRRDMDNTYEWCAEGINPEIDNLKGVPWEIAPSWFERFYRNEHVYIPLVSEMDATKDPEKEILEPQGIISLVTVPMYYGSKLLGFIGFDSVREQKIWDNDTISLLKLAGEIIAGAIFRYKFEIEIIKQKQIADNANKAKSEFLANMSHEIRTPMNAILGFSEIMLNTTKDETYKGYLETIRKSGKTLLSLINDILDLSKIEAGMLDLQPDAVRLKDIVDDVSQIFSQQIKSKKLNFKVSYSSRIPEYFFIDEVRLRQVLLNLVGNAVKFTKEGGVLLSIETEVLDDSHHDIIIKVEDTGIGIAEEDKDVIFESFRQASGVSIKHFGGTGLGLAISNRLVNMMNGTISLESQLGVGSVFTVRLNNIGVVESDKQEIKSIDWNEKAIDFGGRKLLIVDDIQQNIDIVKIYLEDVNLAIAEVNNGQEAISFSKKFMPELILMDLRMPGLSGYETTELIKNNKQTSKIPIVAFTASSMKSDHERIEFEFDGFLRKPINRNELIDELIKHIEAEISDIPGEIVEDFSLDVSQISSADIPALDEFEKIFIPKIADLVSYMDLSEIEEFINNAEEFINKSNLQVLGNCIASIKNSYENFDIEKLEQQLSEMKNLLDNARANCK